MISKFHKWVDVLLETVHQLRPTISSDADLSVHTLICHQHLIYYLFSIKMFLTLSGLATQVVAYDDGTLSRDDASILQNELPGITMIPATAVRSSHHLRRFPNCARFLHEHVLAPKLLAVHRFAYTNRIILLDSDVLFLRHPEEIVNWCLGKDTVTGMYAADPSRNESVTLTPYEFAQAGSHFVPHFNSGLCCLLRDQFKLSLIEKTLPILRFRRRSSRWLEEQTLWALLVGRHSFRVLPSHYLMRGIHRPCRSYDLSRLTAIHYSSPKDQFFREGVQYLIARNRLQGPVEVPEVIPWTSDEHSSKRRHADFMARRPS